MTKIIKGDNLISSRKKVFCPICNDKKLMNQITWNHLKKHNLTIKEFKHQYPSCYLIHPELEKENKLKRKEGKKQAEKTLVEKQCWNFKECSNIVKVNINNGNINVTCADCRKQNLFHPNLLKNKKRLSKQALLINQDKDIIQKRTNSLNNRTEEDLLKTKRKREQTLIDKFGDNWKQVQHEKTKQGMLNNHGCEYALQKNEFREKAQLTYLNKTGFEHAMYNPEIVNKLIRERKPKQKIITKKTQKTNLQKYGSISPLSNQTIIEKGKQTRFINQQHKILKFLKELGFELLSKYKHAHHKIIFKHVGGCKYEWKTTWNNFWNNACKGNPCPNCKPKNTIKKTTQNKIQKIIELFVKPPLLENRIFLGDGRELDFIITEKKIAIEYNGLYWHNEEILKKTRKNYTEDISSYHLTKLEICEEKGYRLITIFEDEWVHKQEIVISRLKHILGGKIEKRIHARKCIIKQIKSKQKNKFLNKYHLQGSRDNASLSLGAFYKNKLISIMTFGKPRGRGKFNNTKWELKRFCSNSNYHIPGIASKLLSHFKRNFKWDYIISFADRRWSNGNLYYKLGFELVNKGTPSPWFIDINKIKKYHRSIMWKSKEDKETDLTQMQLAIIKGYKIIWDCGNLKFILKNKMT